MACLVARYFFWLAQIWQLARVTPVMKKIIMFLMLGALPLVAQQKVWSLDVTDVLANAVADSTQVQINPSSSAWVLVQNETSAKLVRVGREGKVVKYTLPASESDYSFRISSENKCVVQSGRLVTTLTYKKIEDPVTRKKAMGWQQKDIELPEDEDETGFEVAYDREEQRINNHVWYLTQDASGILQQVVLREVP